MASALDYYNRQATSSVKTASVSAPVVDYSRSVAPPSPPSTGSMTVTYSPLPGPRAYTPPSREELREQRVYSSAPSGGASGGSSPQYGPVAYTPPSQEEIRREQPVTSVSPSEQVTVERRETKEVIYAGAADGAAKAEVQDAAKRAATPATPRNPYQPLTAQEREGGVSSGKPLGRVVSTRWDARYGTVEEIETSSGKRIEWSERWKSDVAGGKGAASQDRPANASKSLQYASDSPRIPQEQMNEVVDTVPIGSSFKDQSGQVFKRTGEKEVTRTFTPLPESPENLVKLHKDAEKQAAAQGANYQSLTGFYKVGTSQQVGEQLFSEPTTPAEYVPSPRAGFGAGVFPALAVSQTEKGSIIGGTIGGMAVSTSELKRELELQGKSGKFTPETSAGLLETASKIGAQDAEAARQEMVFRQVTKDPLVVGELMLASMLSPVNPFGLRTAATEYTKDPVFAAKTYEQVLREQWTRTNTKTAFEEATESPVVQTVALTGVGLGVGGVIGAGASLLTKAPVVGGAIAPIGAGIAANQALISAGLGVVYVAEKGGQIKARLDAGVDYKQVYVDAVSEIGTETIMFGVGFKGLEKGLAKGISPELAASIKDYGLQNDLSAVSLSKKAAEKQVQSIASDYAKYSIEQYSYAPKGANKIEVINGKTYLTIQGKGEPFPSASIEGKELRGATYYGGTGTGQTTIEVLPIKTPSGYVLAPYSNVPAQKATLLVGEELTIAKLYRGKTLVGATEKISPVEKTVFATEKYVFPEQLTPTLFKTEGIVRKVVYGSTEKGVVLTANKIEPLTSFGRLADDALIGQKAPTRNVQPPNYAGGQGTVSFPSKTVEPYRLTTPEMENAFTIIGRTIKQQQLTIGTESGTPMVGSPLFYTETLGLPTGFAKGKSITIPKITKYSYQYLDLDPGLGSGLIPKEEQWIYQLASAVAPKTNPPIAKAGGIAYRVKDIEALRQEGVAKLFETKAETKMPTPTEASKITEVYKLVETKTRITFGGEVLPAAKPTPSLSERFIKIKGSAVGEEGKAAERLINIAKQGTRQPRLEVRAPEKVMSGEEIRTLTFADLEAPKKRFIGSIPEAGIKSDLFGNAIPAERPPTGVGNVKFESLGQTITKEKPYSLVTDSQRQAKEAMGKKLSEVFVPSEVIVKTDPVFETPKPAPSRTNDIQYYKPVVLTTSGIPKPEELVKFPSQSKKRMRVAEEELGRYVLPQVMEKLTAIPYPPQPIEIIRTYPPQPKPIEVTQERTVAKEIIRTYPPQPKPIEVTQERTVAKEITQLVRPIQTEATRTTTITTTVTTPKTPIIPIPVIPIIPIIKTPFTPISGGMPLFGFGGRVGGRRGKGARPPTRYDPDFTSMMLGIKSKKVPRGLVTGFELRPIPLSASPRTARRSPLPKMAGFPGLKLKPFKTKRKKHRK